MEIQKKVANLSTNLRNKITFGERNYAMSPTTPITNFLVHTKRHCNGGKMVEASLWLKNHCEQGGKIFLTMSGAGSSFQQGIMISELIRAKKIGAISVTGANLEESIYRLVSPDDYGYISSYQELTPEEEKELDRAGLRRITDTFLPEDETVRVILPHFERFLRDAEATGKHLLWHEYFWKLFEEKLITFNEKHAKNCWVYQAYLHNIPIVVPGIEDSTMGNIVTHMCYSGNHPFLSKYKLEHPIKAEVVHHSFSYMHRLTEWYMDNTKKRGLAFLQLGGGIAADFPICAVPHLKKDFLEALEPEEQDKLIKPWAGFIEIGSSPMSFGSYSGAGFKEKITWSKFEVDAYGCKIDGDYTEFFPDIAAIVLGW